MRPVSILGAATPMPTPAVDLKPEMTWWQKTAAGLLAMVVSTACAFVGSHWGGVTNDQMTKALKDQDERLGDAISKAILTAKKDSDDMKAYVDKKTAAPAPLAKKVKRPKLSEPMGGASE
jgi:hypothetical protein